MIMIDKYKRAKAARQISEKVVDAKGFDDSKPTHLAFLDGHVDGFNAGAKWMQEEFLKDLWHPASEEPRKDVSIMVETHNDKNMFYYVWNSWQDNFYPFWTDANLCSRVSRWLYIDDLLPKEGGNNERA